jgi:hypothetical protein
VAELHQEVKDNKEVLGVSCLFACPLVRPGQWTVARIKQVTNSCSTFFSGCVQVGRIRIHHHWLAPNL